MYERVPIDPGMTPRSPSAALMAPLRVIDRSLPRWCLHLGEVVVAVDLVDDFRRRHEPADGRDDQGEHLLAVAHRVLLGPQHVLDVRVELRAYPQ